jgi:hypothetical protein
MSTNKQAYQNGPESSSPDISQLATTRLRPFQPRAKTSAEHKAEIRYLSALADTFEQAITALIIRMHMESDTEKREALEHSRSDLQRYKDELVSRQGEHRRAIERLQAQE